MIDLAIHFLVFAAIAVAFLALPLIIGFFVRPKLPTPEKGAIYECGEPTIGSSYIQFDLRFYVVALLFIIFDVEVAFFFPWAVIYGESTQLADPRLSTAARTVISEKLLNTPAAQVPHVVAPGTAWNLAALSLVDIVVFFGVLLVGFAYVWKRGDLDWVRAVSRKTVQPSEAIARTTPPGSNLPGPALPGPRATPLTSPGPEPRRVPQTVR
jgi:NADH-quinone oxidoreductase subunit A